MAEQAERKHRPLSTNEQEISVLKKAFADTDGSFHILRIVRSLFLGFPITANDAILVQSIFKDPEVKTALRKKMYPILSSEVPIGEESDFWFGTETEILGKDPNTIEQVVMSKQRCLEMLEISFALLDDPSGPTVSLAYDPKSTGDPFQISLLTRNKYVKTVVTGLAIIKVITGQKDETPEAALKRLQADSTK